MIGEACKKSRVFGEGRETDEIAWDFLSLENVYGGKEGTALEALSRWAGKGILAGAFLTGVAYHARGSEGKEDIEP